MTEKRFRSFDELWRTYFPRHAEEERLKNMSPTELARDIVETIFEKVFR